MNKDIEEAIKQSTVGRALEQAEEATRQRIRFAFDYWFKYNAPETSVQYLREAAFRLADIADEIEGEYKGTTLVQLRPKAMAELQATIDAQQRVIDLLARECGAWMEMLGSVELSMDAPYVGLYQRLLAARAATDADPVAKAMLERAGEGR